MCSDGFHVENVEYLGRGTHSGDSRTPYALVAHAESTDATGTVKNLVAKKGSAWAHYNGADGRIGIFAGGGHEGTLRIVDCQLEEFGNNGIYANDNTGNVQVIGGVYRNNNVDAIRIGGAGSYVDGALIEVDPAKYTGPRTKEDRAFNMRGIVIAQKPEKWGWKDAGAEIRNCDIHIRENPSGSSAAVHAWPTARTVSVVDSTIRMEEGSPAIRRDSQRDTSIRRASSGARWVRCVNVDVSGTGRGSTAVLLEDADGSEVTGSLIVQEGPGSDGVTFENSTDCLVSGGQIETTRYPVHVQTDRRQLGEEECLVTFRNRPRLLTTDRRLAALRNGGGPTTTLEQDRWLASERCLDGRTLDPLWESGGGLRNVAVTGTDRRSLLVSAVDLPRG